MKYLQPKAPTSTTFYMIDYNKVFEGDTINNVLVEVASGNVYVERQVFKNTAIGLMLSGGDVDTEALLTLTIATNAGQQITDTASLYIIANENDIDYSIVTKQQIVEYAFQDLRLSGYIFDQSSDEISAMLSRLDALMREYRLKGINTGYNHPQNIGTSNLNDIAGIEDGLTLSIASLVACSYMDGIGKTYSPSLIKKQQNAFNFVYAYCRKIPNKVFPHFTPRGAGGKLYSTQFPWMFNTSPNERTNLLNSLSGQYITTALWDEALWNDGKWN